MRIRYLATTVLVVCSTACEPTDDADAEAEAAGVLGSTEDSTPLTTPTAASPGSAPTTALTTQAATVTAPPADVPPAQSFDDIPLVESGTTYASPVGDIRWTRIDGDASSVPQSVDFESDGKFYGVDDDGTSWVSDDGIAWFETDPLPGDSGNYANGGDNGLETLQNLPTGLREVVKVGDVALALSRDDQSGSRFSLWRTDDLSTWEPVDIPMDEPGTLRWVTLASNGTEAILDLGIDPPMHGEVWITDDGTTWRTTNVPLVWSSVVFTDFGSVRANRGDGTGRPLEIRPGASDSVSWEGDSVWVSRDGIDWQGFGLEFVPSPNGGWTRTNVLANKIFVGQQAGTDRSIWVGDVQTG